MGTRPGRRSYPLFSFSEIRAFTLAAAAISVRNGCRSSLENAANETSRRRRRPPRSARSQSRPSRPRPADSVALCATASLVLVICAYPDQFRHQTLPSLLSPTAGPRRVLHLVAKERPLSREKTSLRALPVARRSVRYLLVLPESSTADSPAELSLQAEKPSSPRMLRHGCRIPSTSPRPTVRAARARSAHRGVREPAAASWRDRRGRGRSRQGRAVREPSSPHRHSGETNDSMPSRRSPRWLHDRLLQIMECNKGQDGVAELRCLESYLFARIPSHLTRSAKCLLLVRC